MKTALSICEIDTELIATRSQILSSHQLARAKQRHNPPHEGLATAPGSSAIRI
jgi:hypothetical protein